MENLQAKNLIVIALAVLLIGAGSFYLGTQYTSENGEDQPTPTPGQKVSNFEECAAAGYPVMESHPRQCRDGEGNLHVEDLGEKAEKDDLIRVDSPRIEQQVSSPLVIEGEARGNWFFEATFPVTLTDWDGKIIAEHYAQAEGEWMTENYVPFEATLEFESPVFEGADENHFSRRGSLILHKANASGLPEHDNELEFTVWFK